MSLAAHPRVLTDAEHAALAGFLAREAGLVFDASRRTTLAGIVADRIAATGTADLGAYLARVSSASGREERQTLLDAVAVPETHFFRNPPQMDALRRRILPELMRRAAARGRPLTVWSAGCSSGEEPYSLAILAAEVAESLSTAPPVRVLATDLSSVAVEATRAGRYAGRSIAPVDEARLERWFTRRPDGSVVVSASVRDQVEVRLHNLVTDPLPVEVGEVDLVVCRNVMIYFGRDTMRELVGGFHAALGPGGYLMLGHAETLWQVTDVFTLVGLGDAFVYRKDAPVVPEPAPAPAEAPAPWRLLRRTEPRAPRAPRVVRPAPPADAVPDVDQASHLLLLAREAFAQTRYAESARLAAAAAAASPFEVEAYLMEGRARATVGDDPGALVALRKAVYLSPKAGDARFQLAGALARCGEHGAAAREYRAAAAALPATPESALEDLLDGCDVGQLVELSRRLAEECERRAREESS